MSSFILRFCTAEKTASQTLLIVGEPRYDKCFPLQPKSSVLYDYKGHSLVYLKQLYSRLDQVT